MSLLMGCSVWLLGKINLQDWLVLIMQIVAGVLLYGLLSLIFKNKDFLYLKQMCIEYRK